MTRPIQTSSNGCKPLSASGSMSASIAAQPSGKTATVGHVAFAPSSARRPGNSGRTSISEIELMTAALILLAIFVVIVALIVIGIGRLSSTISRWEEDNPWEQDERS